MVVVLVVDSAFSHLFGIDVIEPDIAVGLVHGFVAPLFHFHKVFQSDVQVVDFRPDGLHIGACRSPWGHLQRYFIFIVVFGEVGTDTHEDAKVLVVERAVLLGCFGVDEHFEVFVLTQVEVGGLVDGPAVTVNEVLHGHLQRLLIDAGGLGHADNPFLLDAGRDDVGHGLAMVVFVDADRRNVKSGFVADVVWFVFAGGLDALRIGAPFALHKVEGGETQHDGTLETVDEHTHKADGRIVVDVADDPVRLLDGDAELVPSGGAEGAVRQRDLGGLMDVGNVVVAHYHLGGVEVDDILVITLGFAQGVVAVDVFGIGQGGIAVRINLGLLHVGR